MMKPRMILWKAGIICLAAMAGLMTACGLSDEGEQAGAGSSAAEAGYSAPFGGAAEAEDGVMGLSREQWESLQAEQAAFEAMTPQQQAQALEGGTVGCKRFLHLAWEETFAMPLIDYVGSEPFEAWAGARGQQSDLCLDLYAFARDFSIDQETLVSLIEENGLTELYDLDTLQRRYDYFAAHPEQLEPEQ